MTRRRSHRPGDPVWRHRHLSKSKFLLAVRERLLRDVGPYLDLIREAEKKGQTPFGFWGTVRMLFPVVDALAHVVHPKSRQWDAPPRLLRRLGIRYPYLTWQMYRHTLVHNDEMASASYRGRVVAWGIGFGTGHSWKKGQMLIDAGKLYESLVSFLSKEALKSSKTGTQVWVRHSFHISRKSRNLKLRGETLKLGVKS